MASAHASEAVRVYRFGGWTLVAPAALDRAALAPYAPPLNVPAEGLELLAYWQDGSQRAVGLRFDALDPQKDTVVVRSAQGTNVLKGCKLGGRAPLKKLKDVLPGGAASMELPEGSDLILSGSGRSLHRTGEVLVADMGTARVQLIEDSPIVRKGLWNSADFCRIELNPIAEPDDDAPY